MRDAEDYLAFVKAQIVVHARVIHWQVMREEAQEDEGLYRYRLTLENGDLLEAFERFQVQSGQVQVIKYSSQWQDAHGTSRKRWDNAAHHPELATFPHHVHEGPEERVSPHQPMALGDVLALLEEAMKP